MDHPRENRFAAAAGWIAVPGITLLAIGLRLWRIDATSLWMDEAWSVWIANRPFAGVLALVRQADVHPPLYYILLRAWMSVFGSSPAAVRSLSVVLSSAAIPIVFVIARRILPRRAALAAALLTAVSPFQVHYGRETRMYALLFLAAAVSTHAFLRILAADVRFRTWIAWTVSTAVAVSSLHMGALLPVSQALTVLLLRARGDRLPLRPLLIAAAAALALWLPLAPFLVVQARAVMADWWVPPVDVEGLANAVLDVSGLLPIWGWSGPRSLFRFALLSGILLLLTAGAGWMRRRSPAFVPLLVTAVFPPIVQLAVSLRRPIFGPRSFLWVSLPLAIFLAAAVEATASRSRVAGAMILSALLILPAFRLTAVAGIPESEPWRDVAAAVAADAADGDLVLYLAAYGRIPFEIAAPGEIPGARQSFPIDISDLGRVRCTVLPEDETTLRKLAERYRRIRLVASHLHAVDPDAIARRCLARILREERVRTFGRITLVDYVPRRATRAGG